MNALPLLVLPFALVALVAQTPTALAPESGVVQPPAVTPDRIGLLFDEAPGVVWARHDTWKASFDANGATFIPCLGSQAPGNFPVRFDLATLGVGGAAPTIVRSEPRRDGATITLDRGCARELFVASEAGIEQRFVFDALPQRGAITVGIDVRGDFTVTEGPDGFRFHNEFGSFGYGAAVAIDADGARLPLTTTWNGARFTITVPGAFVERAALPLTIDPLVGNVITVSPGQQLKAGNDIAYDGSLHTFVVCWSQYFSGADVDCYVQPYDDAMVANGPATGIDFTTDSWTECRIANLNAYDRFLVVANRRLSIAFFTQVASRTYSPTGSSLGTQTQLSVGSVYDYSPDVGGDPSLQTPTFFTVVFERYVSDTDSDVFYLQVQQDGTPRAAPSQINGWLGVESAPHISKSNGRGPASVQDWLITFRDGTGAGVGGTQGVFVTWNGILRSTPFNLSIAAALVGGEVSVVSSPTDPAYGSLYMVVDSVPDVLHSYHMQLRATVVDRQGIIVALASQLTDGVLADYDPTVDTDGGRFAIGYVEGPSQALNVATCDIVGQQVVVRETIPVAPGTPAEDCRIVAMHGAGASSAFDREYAMTWRNGSQPTQVLATRYRGMAGSGFGVRATGCGGLGIAISGNGAIGTTMSLSLGGTTGIPGFGFGVSASLPLGPCGCTVGTTADILVVGGVLSFAIPFDTHLVGLSYAMQGFDFGPGTCLGALWLSDTVDLTIH